MRLLLILPLLVPLLTSCETVRQGIKDVTAVLRSDAPQPAPQATRSAEDLLAAGVAQYEEGNYAQAQRLLRSSIAEGLPSGSSQARAYKYLAFIYCVTDRTAQCRQEFSNALNADPKFTLTAAEAGHPTWGPVFRSVSRSR